MDSAGYQASIFNYCDEEKMLFTISGRKDRSVWTSLNDIKDNEWEILSKKEKISEFVHSMNGTDNAFRMIVVKKDITPILPTLEGYISEEVMKQHRDEMYYCIATNDNDLTAKEIVKLHRQRGET
ncbi:MAG: hypothetical protein Q9M32_08865, partial [Sulfurimonas sp.]|nr:hypothetical protein [Sulfurimonas sp.]